VTAGKRHGATPIYVIEQLGWFGVGLAFADILLSKLKVVTSPTFFWISAIVMTAAVATRAALVEWRVSGNTLVVRQMCTTRRIPVDEIERVALKGTVFPSSGLRFALS
jgi:hypothetical protein